MPFFVEVDLGTEDLPRLTAKITAYETWSERTGHVWPVLYWLGSPRREHHLHQRLTARPTCIPIATATRTANDQDHGSPLATGRACEPAGPIWRLHVNQRRAQPNCSSDHEPLGELPGAARRLSLADLATTVTIR